jgi:hypothetical protein
MTRAQAAASGPTLGSRVRALEIGGAQHELLCRYLVLAAAATLFLHDAATAGVSYTLRISYGIMAVAVVVGAPFVLRGWRAAPVGVVMACGFLLFVYFVAGLAGVNPSLAGGGRASSTRWVVYILDMCLGLASMGLILGLFGIRRQVQQLLVALVVGALLAATYGIYQWFAQQHGWPLSNVDNAANSDNFTTGARFQGLGLFGRERIRGTFVEPFALGIYLSAMLPLVVIVLREQRRRALFVLGVAIMLVALLLTDSSLAWASLLIALAVVGTAAAIAGGRPMFAGVAGAVAALLAVVCVATLAEPSVLSNVTERSGAQLRQTVTARTGAWEEASEIWARRPVLGYGPGASSVELARIDDAVGVTSAPTVLGSAYGVWSASLIDAGVFGILAWLVVFAAVLAHAARSALAKRSLALWGALAAALSAVISSQVGGDRLDLRVWILLAVALALARTTPEEEIARRGSMV